MLPFLLGFFIFKKISLKRLIIDLSIYLVTLLIAFGPLHYRNYVEYDSFSLTSQGGGHALYWVVPATYQYSGKGSYEEGKVYALNFLEQSMLEDNIDYFSENPFKRSSYQMKIAKDAFKELGLLSMLHAWSAATIINIITPSAAYAPIVRNMDHPSFYDTPGNGAVEKLVNYITNANGILYLFILSIGTLLSILFLILSIFGFYKMTFEAIYENQNRYIIFLLLLIIIYFVAITGPIVGVKYRLPIEPILTLFFSYTFVNYLANSKIKILKMLV